MFTSFLPSSLLIQSLLATQAFSSQACHLCCCLASSWKKKSWKAMLLQDEPRVSQDCTWCCLCPIMLFPGHQCWPQRHWLWRRGHCFCPGSWYLDFETMLDGGNVLQWQGTAMTNRASCFNKSSIVHEFYGSHQYGFWLGIPCLYH